MLLSRGTNFWVQPEEAQCHAMGMAGFMAMLGFEDSWHLCSLTLLAVLMSLTPYTESK
jgi:hypothetical protein